MKSSELILHIGTFNRKAMTEICIKQIWKYKKDCTVWIHDDGSSEYGLEFLRPYCHILTSSQNIGNTRAVFENFYQIKEMSENDEQYKNIKYIYHSDNDVFHDKDFVDVLVNYYNKYELPISLMKTAYTIVTEELEDGYRTPTLPGASIMFPVSMVSGIDINFSGGWDTYCNGVFKENFIHPTHSYAEHYDFGGVHSMIGLTMKGINWCVNPTPYMERFKPMIMKKIGVR